MRCNEKTIQYLHHLRDLSHKTEALRRLAPEWMPELGEPFGAVWDGVVVPLDGDGGELLFNVLSERYERKATLVTTNLDFSQWPRVFR